MGGGGGSQTVGYKYYLGIHMVLCHGPVDNISKITIDDRTAWEGTSTGGTITVNKPDLFGGEAREGGVSGNIDVDMGETTQGQNSYLVSKLGALIPNYRGVVSLVLNQFYIGNNPYLKKWAVRATRNLSRTDGRAPLTGVTMAIGDDMNPVSIIHECLTDDTWGMGYNYSDIDEASFVSAGATLYSEGMGMSLLWDGQMTIEKFILEILKHIDGSLYVDKSTGLFTIKLVRDDYTFANLPILDESNIVRIADFNRPIVGELTNTVTVVYKEASTGNKATVTVQDIALQLTQQQTIGSTLQYPGFTDPDTAAKVASRDLLSVSTPLITCSIFCTRAVSDLTIGDPFRLQWDEFGISDVVMRVTSLAYGTQGSSQIKITASQDVFAVGDAVVSAAPITEWTDYRSDPIAAIHRFIYEIPYWEVVMKAGQAEADAMGEFDTGFLICASRPTDDALSANLMTSGVNGYETRTVLNFSPYAELAADIGYLDTTVLFSNADSTVTYKVGTYIQIDEELLKVSAITASQATVERGVLDTIPAQHSIGTPIYFNGELSDSDGVTYQYNETVGVQLATITGLGTLVNPPTDSYLLNRHRQYRPYPPAAVRINGTFYPATIPDTSDITITWATRSRLQLTTEALYAWTIGSSYGEETGTTYNTRLLQSNGTLIVEHTGLSSVTFDTFPLADFSAHTTIRVQIESVRDGYTCLQIFDHQFDRVTI